MVRVPEITPARRSAMLAIVGGMMAAVYMDSMGMVDLSFGFPPGSAAEGALMAMTGAVAGYGVLLIFRVLRNLTARDRR